MSGGTLSLEIRERYAMGSVVFEGSAPFGLALQGVPTVLAEGKDVVLTFPVSVSDQETVGLRIQLSIRQAEHLAAQIQPVLLTARSRARRGA
jgi:hypothetical protein